MSRLIDADALCENLGFAQNCNDCKIGKNCTCETFSVYGICTALADAPTVGGWVSVKDDMPKEHPSIFAPWYGSSRWTNAMWRKESDNVLLAYKTPDTGAYVIKEGRTHDGKFYSGNIVLDNNCEVTHWMKMPKPPKEEKENV